MTDNRSDDKAAVDDLLFGIQRKWDAAVEIKDLPPGGVERALLFGVNVRVKFPEAFVAAYETIEAGHLIAASVATHVSWPLAIWKTYRAASSVFSALIEKMSVLEYTTAVVLSRHKEAVDAETLKQEVDAFLDAPNTKDFGWCAGLSTAKVEDARDGRRRDPDWFAKALQELEKNRFLTRDANAVRYTPKNVEWKWGF